MEFLEQVFLGNLLSDWAIALAWAFGGVVFGKLIFRWISNRMRRVAAKTASDLDDLILERIEGPLALGAVLLGFWLGYGHLHFGEQVD